MPREYFLPKTEAGKAACFEQFRDNIGPYVATFGLAAADVAGQAADATYYRAVLNQTQTMTSAGQQWTGWKGEVLNSKSGSEPALPSKPAGFPAAVAAGILSRFQALVRTVHNHDKYNEPIGEILGIVGSEQTGPDMATIRPDFDAAVSGIGSRSRRVGADTGPSSI